MQVRVQEKPVYQWRCWTCASVIRGTHPPPPRPQLPPPIKARAGWEAPLWGMVTATIMWLAPSMMLAAVGGLAEAIAVAVVEGLIFYGPLMTVCLICLLLRLRR